MHAFTMLLVNPKLQIQEPLLLLFYNIQVSDLTAISFDSK